MRKGKVYPSSPPLSPSTSSSSSSSSSSYKDPDSVIKLLPVTILALALSLPRQDLEVLAYLIARSIVASTTNPHHKTKCRAIPTKKNSQSLETVIKVPVFECGCFDCYTSFWYRWDSSPNRDLIHHAIEAFEEHLVLNESTKRHKSKRRARVTPARCEPDVSVIVKPEKVKEPDMMMMISETESFGNGDVEENVVLLCEGDEENTATVVNAGELEMEEVTVNAAWVGHRGLARKVLPDVVGLFNSRLWSLWSPGT